MILMVDLIDQQLSKEMPICCGGSMDVDGGIYYCPVCEDSENWVESDELLNIFTTNQVREVQINYVIMEYLPEKADPIEHTMNKPHGNVKSMVGCGITWPP